jgi:gliding motility-associated lipoprotein GldH
MRNYLFLFVAIILLSCNKTRYENYYSFNNNGWNTDTIINFKYNIVDTVSSYNVKLKIRHTVNYEFQNLFLFLEETKKDTIEIYLANKIGKWIGSGISDIREVEYVFDEKRVFDKKGHYYLKIEQAMRYGSLDKIENLEHILAVGLIISENND